MPSRAVIFPMRGARRRTGRTGVLLGLGVVSVLIAIAAIPACSNYSEGERCESANNNLDCQSDLTCTPAAQLTNTTSDRCCPSDRALASETVCKVPPSGGTAASDAAASAETGITTDPGSSTDAGDASSDAPTDG